MYLIVYNSEVDPAHWSILVPQQNSQTVGTMIHVVSSPNGGFQHQIRAYDGSYRISSAFTIQFCMESVAARNIIC